MTYTPDEAALQRVAAYVRRALNKPGFVHPKREEITSVSPEALDTITTGTSWLDDDTRTRLEDALGWFRGDIEWIAQGGEPSPGDDGHRYWRVRVVVEQTVEAPTHGAALAAVAEPVREAFAADYAGIVECSATNTALIKRRRAEAIQAGRDAAAHEHQRWLTEGNQV